MTATTLIIGASRGIGLELTRQYILAGDRVIASARNADGLARLRELGAETLTLDVTDPASVSTLAWQLDGEKINTAWHVAGVMCSRADASQPPSQAEFDRVMHANVLGAMQVLVQVAPLVADARGRYGFVSSVMGLIGDAGASNAWLYRTSKAALNMAVTSAAHNYPDALMRVFHPGWVQTDMGGQSAPVGAQESAAGLRAALATVSADAGTVLIHHDGSQAQGW